MSGSTKSLGETLIDVKAPLALRFRALFSLKALGGEGDLEAIDAIAAGFRDDSELLKHELAYVLGQTKQEAAIAHLTNVLEDMNQQPMVRHEAAEALGAIGDERSLEILTRYEKEDPLEIVRQTCELAIERINWVKSNAANPEQLQKSLYSSIDPAPPLASSSLDTTEEVTRLQVELNNTKISLFNRYRAMFRLRDIGTESAVDALASGFGDSSALFRHEIAYVFGQMSHIASVPALIKVLEDTQEEGMVRHEAAEALGSIASDEVLPVLAKFAKDSERVVAESCIVANDMAEYEQSQELHYAPAASTAIAV
ncbi:Deoxyhypusine hydroxylase [Taphrina deformans PYCC 5710]|uniref:Deoxyhypusine hydroxylase n=1 Tax=Taphrina deformans (strain PYCC 5710 / ATCC 11124 / CBS 356.35 / IMI 108563 / JCM 9778 / NBRC 8474) TaxID=1097556 RepID=R4XAK9_TAPDE|nr:Deoxyhypusine hydroxylase [Taphrina deformans PYCC 5710]|eukprot:CCG82869.1 Deoxyhypusine hydroxylase [Taphrina deformans PYCC 5710]